MSALVVMGCLILAVMVRKELQALNPPANRQLPPPYCGGTDNPDTWATALTAPALKVVQS